jgi:23S rRNA-/tRNA-specific pseudouridylate synthase
LLANGGLPAGSVLYSDAHVAVLDKQPGVHTEPLRPEEEGTLLEYFLLRFPQAVRLVESAGSTLLSRLDFDTSGAVLAALTEPAFRFLVGERKAGRIFKRYVCRVAGRFEREETIRYELATRGTDRVRVHRKVAETDPAFWTEATPIGGDGSTTLVSVRIVKGKRHQIRAHMAAAGHPIVGDRLYGGTEDRGRGSGRLLLHAAEVTFAHPESGTRMTVVSPLPEGF